jgi:hypothetical protein
MTSEGLGEMMEDNFANTITENITLMSTGDRVTVFPDYRLI